MKILLVEPDYNNKFPPIGLMKISTYYREKGDFVEFCKGLPSHHQMVSSDKIFVTSLFTFYYDKTVETVNHIRNFASDDSIYLGGIAATIMAERFRKDIGEVNIQIGQRKTSEGMGYQDDVNIDELPLDYDILDDVMYKYPMEDNFFAYSTRGCRNKCKFCAVSKLEPEFKTTNNLVEQITTVREKFGDKRNILLMDNNVLYSKDLASIATDLKSLGFENGVKNFVKPNPLHVQMQKIERRMETGNNLQWVLYHLTEFLRSFRTRVTSDEKARALDAILEELNENMIYSKERIRILQENYDTLTEITETYLHKMKLQRYVDFNQGIDARALTEERMKIISPLPIRPFRLAYDNIKFTSEYQKAFKTAYKHGVRHFSNYMLYNYDERPEDLWNRLENNINLYKGLPEAKLFSFPMKYAPIDQTDRKYVGKHWTKKQLGAMNVILNVTRGVVMAEDDFFHRAYGSNPKEFLRILAMPDDYIKYRNNYEENGLAKEWLNEYDTLDESQQDLLLDVLSDKGLEAPESLNSILKHYSSA